MAPIDPMQLLNALNSHLSPQGGLSKIEDVPRLANVMKKFSRKLVSKCIYCNVLQSTQSEILEPYLAKGGWETINIWLQFAQGFPNISFLMELLKLCRQLPMTVNRLKENNTAKIVKSLAKHENAEIKTISAEIVTKWMSIIKEGKVEIPVDKKKSKSKEKKDKDKEKEKKERKEKEKERKEKEKNDKEKLKTHKQEPKSENSKAVIHDTRVRRNSKEILSPKKSLEEQISALKLKSGKRASSEKVEYCDDVKIDPLDFLPPPKKSKPDRPKTVRIYQKKFRSTGLEEEVVLPRKGSKKPAPATTEKTASLPKTTLKRQTTAIGNIISDKKSRPENSAVSDNSSKKGIQLIPAKPKPTYTLIESGGFMDALMGQPSPEPVRKRRKSKTLTSPTSPTLKPPKLQFYKDTLDMNEKKEEKEQPLSPKDQEERTEMRSESPENASELSPTEEMEPRPFVGGLKPILSYSRRKGKKKTVKWVSDDKIKSVRYFDMDETERENVTKSQNFGDLKSIEQKREREIFELARKFSAPGAVKRRKRIPWIPVDTLPPMAIAASHSNVKISEARRQLSILQEIYFTPEMIPDSAVEPELELSLHTDMKQFPLNGDFENVPLVLDNSTNDYPKDTVLPDDLMSKLQGISASLKFHQQNIQGSQEGMHDASKMTRGQDMNKMNRRPDENKIARGQDMNQMMRGQDMNQMMRGRDMNQMMRGQDMNQMMREQDMNQMMRGPDMNQMHFNNDANRMIPSYESMPMSPSSPYDPGEPLGNMPGPSNHGPPNMYGMPHNVMHNMPPDMPNMMQPDDWNMEMHPPQHLIQGQQFYENYPPHMNQMMMHPQMNHDMMPNHMQPGMNMRPPLMQQDKFPRQKPVRYRKVPCRHFQSGKCRFGDSCTFLHPGVDGPLT